MFVFDVFVVVGIVCILGFWFCLRGVVIWVVIDIFLCYVLDCLFGCCLEGLELWRVVDLLG